MGVADILPSPCQLLQFGAASSHPAWLHLRARQVWRNVWRSEGDSPPTTAHTQSTLASRMRPDGGAEKMLKYCPVLHLNNTGSIFPPDSQWRPTVRSSNSFQNPTILPLSEFCLFPGESSRGAGVADGSRYQCRGGSCRHKSDKHSRLIKTLLTPPQHTGS